MSESKSYKTQSSHSEILPILGLLAVTLLWGFGFVSLKICETLPTFFLISARFGMAAVILSAIFYRSLKNISRELLFTAFLAGLFIFLCYTFATIGIRYTTASKNAFFTCLEALFVPIISFIIFRIKPERKFIYCLFICIVGIFLISMGGGDNSGIAIGDIISLGASVTFAFQLIILGHRGQNHDPIALTIIQLYFVTIFSLITMVITGEHIPTAIPTFTLFHMIYLGIGASGLAFILQTISIKGIASHRGALILTAEPVLGAVFCAIFLNDYLGIKGYIGGLLVFASIFLSEADIGSLRKDNSTKYDHTS